MYVLHGWYYMPASVHKLLVYGEVIIRYALVSIGQLFEKAQEAIHKKFKRHNTRKC